MESERDKKIKELKDKFFNSVENFTPEEIKDQPIFDLSNPDEIVFTLTKEFIEKYELEKWLVNYEKEAKVSTGGIRGPQNVLYYWDTRFPINQMGVALATLGKGLVLKDNIKDRDINKVVSGEVRYNTKEYIELISRIQAALGINIHLPYNREITTIWLTSFLIFMSDYDGGEYVTSSHAISSKIATKDLESQGSQFLPEMSLAFIAKIKEIFAEAKNNPNGYTIKLSAQDNPLIKEDFNGFDIYVDYLRNSAATKGNLDFIRKAEEKGLKIIFDTVGGCMYRNMVPILKKLGISDIFEWRNKEEDPFFHGIGKIWRENPETKKKEFFDLSCDACLLEVVESMGYEEDLKDKEIGQLVLITDPDADRLVIGQVEPIDKAPQLDDLGINYIKIDESKIFSVYHPTYSFLMTMDFYAKQLKKTGLWSNHPRTMITTAPSSRAWDEWAKSQGVDVVTVPVGFKEIAITMQKIEKQLLSNPGEEVIIKDILGRDINLGIEPRIVFAGEESGGMIAGPEEMIVSRGGRKALAMREKSAGEASIITAALAADLFLKKKSLTDYLKEIFEENNITSRYYFRDDIIYYNESEADPVKMMKEKLAGEIKRDKTDKFYLGLTLALKEKIINIDQVREILSEVFPKLDFSNLEDLIFVGESTHLKFNDIFVQIRRSGTDAKMRGYSGGKDKERCELYLRPLLHYDGTLTDSYKKLITDEFYGKIYQKADKIYKEYLYRGL